MELYKKKTACSPGHEHEDLITYHLSSYSDELLNITVHSIFPFENGNSFKIIYMIMFFYVYNNATVIL